MPKQDSMRTKTMHKSSSTLKLMKLRDMTHNIKDAENEEIEGDINDESYLKPTTLLGDDKYTTLPYAMNIVKQRYFTIPFLNNISEKINKIIKNVSTWNVYKINCIDCDASYVSQTNRTLITK
ncbi:hypothetical protein ALC53_01341 [Atta colombica]|uniref:Uncharacterized protein n=1 Tax=Atta colombica TaxID=520822 RepID=A0A151I5T1_9HYME|nr:hypothetical protein ALC53_01341 [Atta colombica]